jgi:uncharacterized membrane-anchored protein
MKTNKTTTKNNQKSKKQKKQKAKNKPLPPQKKSQQKTKIDIETKQNKTKKGYNTESKKVFLIIETSKLQPSYGIGSFNLIQTCHLCGDNKNHKIRNCFYL